MATISTVRPHTKPNRPTLSAEDRVISDNSATGVGSTRWADLQTQLSTLYPPRTERNVALGYAGIAADGLIDASILRAALVPEEVADDATKNALVVVAGDIGRRLVRVTASGINYLAKATGSGADKWIQYNSNPAATDALAGVVELATSAEAVAGTDTARAVTPAADRAALLAYVDPFAASRAPLPGLIQSDNLTVGRIANVPMGAQATFTAEDFTVVQTIVTPSSLQAARGEFGGVGDTPGVLNSAGAMGIIFEPDGKLSVNYGTVATAYRARRTAQPLRLATAYHVVWDWQASTGAQRLWIDGVEQTLTEVNLGAPPAATTPPGGGHVFAGRGPFIGSVPIILTRRLTTPEVEQMARNNDLLQTDRMGASMTAAYVSEFSAGTDSWLQNIGNAALTTTGNADGVDGVDDALVVQNTSAGQLACQIQRVSSARYGARYTVSVDLYAEPGAFTGAAHLAVGAVGTREDMGAPAITEGVWQTFKLEVPVGLSPNLRLAILSTETGSAQRSINAGSRIWIKNIRVVYRGALLQPKVTRTAQILDNGGNRLRGVITAGMRPLSDGDPVGIRGSIAATGNILGLGASDPLWFESGLIRHIRIKPTAAAVTNVTFRLNTSGGTVIGTLATSTLNQWVTLPFSAGSAFEVSSGDKIHITTDAAIDFDIDWSRR